MKNIYIVHCWDGKSSDGWYPWLDKMIASDNIKVIRFDMPDTESPQIEKWVSTLDKYVNGNLNENTYFIGHSIGCQTIMRYLERQNVNKIGGILFVAPWLELLPSALEDEESKTTARPWLDTPIDFNKIKNLTSNIYALFSDDDYFVDIKQEQVFAKLIEAKTKIVSKCGHISQDDGIYELDDILCLTKEMLGCTHKE